MKKYKGMTLIELMATLVVAGILAALAVPSLRSMLVRRQVESAVSALMSDFSFARTEALKRGHSVTICQSANGQDCDSGAGSWHRGWLVFADPSASATPSSGRILRRQAQVEGITAVANQTPANTERFVRFRASGVAPGYDNHFVVTADADVKGGSRLLCLKLGRLQLQPDGSPSC